MIFHFVKVLRNKLNKLNLCKKNKKEVNTILNNIEVICFLYSNNKKFLIFNLQKLIQYTKFIIFKETLVQKAYY